MEYKCPTGGACSRPQACKLRVILALQNDVSNMIGIPLLPQRQSEKKASLPFCSFKNQLLSHT